VLLVLYEYLHAYSLVQVIIDYLKMDVEGAEWNSLKSMTQSDVLSRVKQLGLEIHVQADAAMLYEYWTVLNGLEKRGFRRWYWAMNFRGHNIYMVKTGSRSCCYEMVYINVNFMQSNRLRPIRKV